MSCSCVVAVPTLYIYFVALFNSKTFNSETPAPQWKSDLGTVGTSFYLGVFQVQEHKDDTDAVRAESLTELVAVIVSDVIEKLNGVLGKLENELFNDITDNDCHHLCQ
ncbi:MAG: hypothetical protein FRX49_09287 [Trebouxia sp. A1-2]|nr:MAG: hypothetical protein FRX49_09287 [Trebouxia sp. A1-2]